MTGGKGARIAFDPVTGPGVETLAAAMAEGGTIFLYGALDPAPTPFPLRMAFTKNLTLRIFSLLSAVTTDPQALDGDIKSLRSRLPAIGWSHPISADTA